MVLQLADGRSVVSQPSSTRHCCPSVELTKQRPLTPKLRVETRPSHFTLNHHAFRRRDRLFKQELGDWNFEAGNTCHATMVKNVPASVAVDFTWTTPPSPEDRE